VSDRPIKHLNQVELSRRWSLSPRTLERWRWLGQGPQYLKVGGRVVYRLADIEAFEAARARIPTPPVRTFPQISRAL
jgi:hypothetical protein